MHHICLEVNDIGAMLTQLQSRELRLINRSLRVGGDGVQYAFIHLESTGGVLVELYQV